jgi:hypothetical protein
MYTIYVSDVDNLTSIKYSIIATARITDFITEPKLPIEFTEFADVFNTEKANVLAAHNKNKYTINLDKSKPPFKPLYNLSTKELKVLKTYFNDALAKG